MAPHKTWTVKIRDHPGSTKEEIENEPEWAGLHDHRIGFRNRSDRRPGITHAADEYVKEIELARQEQKKLRDEANNGRLLNFRDIINGQEDFHLRHPKNHSIGWRYVLNTTEDWVKKEEEWPVNIKRRQESLQKEKQGQEDANSADDVQEKKKTQEDSDTQSPQQEHEWKRQKDHDKHHDAYTTDNEKTDPERVDLSDKYSAQELALLASLKHEKEYIYQLQQNDGKGKSPRIGSTGPISIDEQDQFGPDNWLPRSSDLIRLTGKHPLNAEPDLTKLFGAGLITPNELHYVRNHGSVPRLLWEFHQLDIEYNNKVTALSMMDLKAYETVNIPIALACDGNRRKELNMIKKSKGFSWGAGAVSCAYWKGPLLSEVLRSVGVPDSLGGNAGRRYWVNFEGADDPSEGKYSTCIPFEYAMDPNNDVLLAYEMNDVPLPPDHGYPVRVMIPGYVGGRCVKWLRKIWISDKENDSHYHIWDNRVIPAFVTEKDGPFAETLFNHPDTACNEQNLNSVIVKPAQGERISVAEAKRGRSYRIEGYAYDGGGHEVQRVELSLDDGQSWLYCIRKFPDAPIRHGNKFWTWLHWHVDVQMSHLLRAKSLTVRCFNVFKNTQPKDPNWNIMGMMNNCWYVVRPEIVDDENSDAPAILFRHPTEPGTGTKGWMKLSTENQIAQAKQEAGAPQKEFTREEIEKHDSKDDCWIVVDGKVYDATSVLQWHPGGAAAIVGHAGKVHQETSDEFASIHDDFAYQKLKECVLGVVTEKVARFIEKTKEEAVKEKASSSKDTTLALEKHRWIPVKLRERKKISEDTRTYTFELPEGKSILGLGTCQHVQVGFHFQDKMLIRSYTPTRPLLPSEQRQSGDDAYSKDDQKSQEEGEKSLRDGNGTFELTVKTYFPDESQPGGALSNILDCMPLGEEVEIRGPTGDIVYNGNGSFVIEGKERHFDKVSLVLGGSGITPGYSLIARILLSAGDKTQIRVIDANKSQKDILLKQDLEDFEEKSKGQMKIAHVLSHPDEGWEGLTGHITGDIIKQKLFPPATNTVVFLCGPPAMIQKAALPALKEWGYKEDDNMFGF